MEIPAENGPEQLRKPKKGEIHSKIKAESLPL